MQRESKETDDTLRYYKDHAEAFAAGTVDADMSFARSRFLEKLPEDALILDFGCGAGRDVKAFLEAGYSVEATDGSEELCEIARINTGIPIQRMLFQELEEKERYDGIWACASILHLPKAELVDVMRRIVLALKKGGILYTSFKYGTGEGVRDGRYFSDFTEETFETFLLSVDEVELEEKWISADVRPERGEEKWLNVILRKN